MRKFWSAFFIFWPIVAIIACVIAPEMGWWFPGDGVAHSPLGERIDGLFYLILYIVTAVFIGVQIALGYALWRGAVDRQGKAWFSHGSHNLEVIWTIVPAGVISGPSGTSAVQTVHADAAGQADLSCTLGATSDTVRFIVR